jgi:hypothetical protein
MPENPLTNNFYARWFTREEKRCLKKSSPDAQDEIMALRALAGRLTRHLSTRQPDEYSDHDLKLLTSLVRIAAGLGTLMRLGISLQGRDGRFEKSIEEAIQSLEDDWSQA